MYGFETQHLAEARGTYIPSTNSRESGKGHWAGDQKARMALAVQPLPGWATLEEGLNLSGSVSFNEN